MPHTPAYSRIAGSLTETPIRQPQEGPSQKYIRIENADSPFESARKISSGARKRLPKGIFNLRSIFSNPRHSSDISILDKKSWSW